MSINYNEKFKKDSDELTARSRNHNENKFNMDDIKIKLSHKFKWDNSPPVMQKMDYDKNLAVWRSK